MKNEISKNSKEESLRIPSSNYIQKKYGVFFYQTKVLKDTHIEFSALNKKGASMLNVQCQFKCKSVDFTAERYLEYVDSNPLIPIKATIKDKISKIILVNNSTSKEVGCYPEVNGKSTDIVLTSAEEELIRKMNRFIQDFFTRLISSKEKEKIDARKNFMNFWCLISGSFVGCFPIGTAIFGPSIIACSIFYLTED